MHGSGSKGAASTGEIAFSLKRCCATDPSGVATASPRTDRSSERPPTNDGEEIMIVLASVLLECQSGFRQ